MYLTKYFIVLFGMACTFIVQAQAPDWTINPNDYQYTMTVVAFLSVDRNTLTSDQDKVAAFVDGEVRGVTNLIHVPSAGRHLAYLTIFANKENETVEFKIYDSSSGKIVDATKTLAFKIDGQHGNSFQAFSLANPSLSSEAKIENFFFTGVDSVSTIITENAVDIVVEYDQDLQQLSPEFIISSSATMYINRTLQESGKTVAEFSSPITYSVLSEDESVLNNYVVTVRNRQISNEGFVCSNVVTVNNDGENDHWIVGDVFKYKDHHFRIFDANGRVLHESIGYNNDWNGYYKGNRVERGKYYFVIKDPVTYNTIKGDILVLY